MPIQNNSTDSNDGGGGSSVTLPISKANGGFGADISAVGDGFLKFVSGVLVAAAALAISDVTGLQTALNGKLTIPTVTTSQAVLGDGSVGAVPGLSGKLTIPTGTTSQVVLGDGSVGSVPGLSGKLTIPTGTTSQVVLGDGSVGAVPGLSNYLPLAGGTMTGGLLLGSGGTLQFSADNSAPAGTVTAVYRKATNAGLVLNVPSGAGFDFKVNDGFAMALSATQLQVPNLISNISGTDMNFNVSTGGVYAFKVNSVNQLDFGVKGIRFLTDHTALASTDTGFYRLATNAGITGNVPTGGAWKFGVAGTVALQADATGVYPCYGGAAQFWIDQYGLRFPANHTADATNIQIYRTSTTTGNWNVPTGGQINHLVNNVVCHTISNTGLSFPTAHSAQGSSVYGLYRDPSLNYLIANVPNTGFFAVRENGTVGHRISNTYGMLFDAGGNYGHTSLTQIYKDGTTGEFNRIASASHAIRDIAQATPVASTTWVTIGSVTGSSLPTMAAARFTVFVTGMGSAELYWDGTTLSVWKSLADANLVAAASAASGEVAFRVNANNIQASNNTGSSKNVSCAHIVCHI